MLVNHFRNQQQISCWFSMGVWKLYLQGSHSDWKTWKTWKNGKAFSSQGKVREFWTDWKSQGKVRKNHIKYWKTQGIWDKYYLIFLAIFKWTVYYLPKWIKFSVKKNKTLKKYWKNRKKYWNSQGKVREFCQSEKVGTLTCVLIYPIRLWKQFLIALILVCVRVLTWSWEFCWRTEVTIWNQITLKNHVMNPKHPVHLKNLLTTAQSRRTYKQPVTRRYRSKCRFLHCKTILITIRKRSLRRLRFYICLSFCSRGGVLAHAQGVSRPMPKGSARGGVVQTQAWRGVQAQTQGVCVSQQDGTHPTGMHSSC